MLTISADVSQLTLIQREALASFIIAFPTAYELLPSDGISPEDVFSPEVKNNPVLQFPNSDSASVSNLDKAGLPWDERIHASSKALTADGLWRKKRGVEDATVAQVEGQLKQLMSLPTPTVVPEPVPVPAQMATVTEIPAPPPPPAPVTPVVENGRDAFINLVTRVSTTINEKKITSEEVKQICNDMGVAALPLLMSRQDLIPAVAMNVEALIQSRA